MKNLILSLLLCLLLNGFVCGQSLYWIDIFDDVGIDGSKDLDVDDSGNVFVAGFTSGSIGQANLGVNDALLQKYSADGTLLWATQFGTENGDAGHGVCVDINDDILVTGTINERFVSPGGGFIRNLFASKFDQDGNQLWSRQIDFSGSDYHVGEIASDEMGNVYVTGSIRQLGGSLYKTFLVAYDSKGQLLWQRLYSDSSFGDSISVTTGPGPTIYIGRGGTLRKHSSVGDVIWSRDLSETCRDVANDETGNVFVTGRRVVFGIGGEGYLTKYDTDGNQLWIQTFGTSEDDGSNAVSTDNLGNAYLTGSTSGNFGTNNLGLNDLFVSKFDPDGIQLWTQQIGTEFSDKGMGVANDQFGNVFACGYGNVHFEMGAGVFGDIIVAKFGQGVVGDVDGDNAVSVSDVPPFVEVLVQGGSLPEADTNLDGVVNLNDVQPFVLLLTSGQ